MMKSNTEKQLRAEIARLQAQLEALQKPKKTRKVRNLMSGLEIEIDEDTPISCDPSSETYWCM